MVDSNFCGGQCCCLCCGYVHQQLPQEQYGFERLRGQVSWKAFFPASP